MSSASPNAFGGISVPGIRGAKNGYQHDRILMYTSAQGDAYVVFDGHGANEHGHQVADMCQKRFLPLLQASQAWNASPVQREEYDTDLIHDLKGIVEQLDREADPGNPLAKSYPGTTLCAVLIKDRWIYTVNVGDSRAVLAQAAPQTGRQHTPLTQAVQLTEDHAFDNPEERKRVEDAGGVIINGRLNGELGMSRTIGDHEFKAYRNHPRFNKRGISYKDTLLSSTPDFGARPITDQDIFVVLATDGLWSDRVRNDMVILHAEGGLLLSKTPSEIAKSLVSLAIEHGSKDNISIVFISLNKIPEREKRAKWRMRRKSALAENLNLTGPGQPSAQALGIGLSEFGASQAHGDQRIRRRNEDPQTEQSRDIDMMVRMSKRDFIRQAPKRFFRRQRSDSPRDVPYSSEQISKVKGAR